MTRTREQLAEIARLGRRGDEPGEGRRGDEPGEGRRGDEPGEGRGGRPFPPQSPERLALEMAAVVRALQDLVDRVERIERRLFL